MMMCVLTKAIHDGEDYSTIIKWKNEWFHNMETIRYGYWMVLRYLYHVVETISKSQKLQSKTILDSVHVSNVLLKTDILFMYNTKVDA